MRNSDKPKLGSFGSYLLEKKAFLLWTFLTAGIFMALSGLYGYADAAVKMSYALVILLFFLLCYLLADYWRYRSRKRQLREALSMRGESDFFLPEPVTDNERIYNEMVRQTEEEMRRLVTDLDEQRKEMSNYYLMWTHQIKTPIAALKLLQQSRFQEEAADKKGEQESFELFRIEQYVDMVLQYARLYSLSSDMLFQRYSIEALVKRAVKKYSLLIIGRKLSFSMEEFTCLAVTDEKWISFVIEQILSNAVKYTISGGIRIYGADKTGCEKSGQVTAIAIEDTGIGIQEADLPRIFERGFTGYNGRMDKKSTGIGLYLCRQIIDKLGHRIFVQSVQGSGTKVVLSFEQQEAEGTHM